MGTYRIKIQYNHICDINIAPGLFHKAYAWPDNIFGSKRNAILITDSIVDGLYGSIFMSTMQQLGIAVKKLVVEPGEKTKSIESASSLWEQLVHYNFHRRDILIAFGGGVITDLVGFVASNYMRGVPYVIIPTTLVAQLDAAIGGKVAINHYRAKNLLGAFYHPEYVFIDVDLLRTLPVQEIRNGLAEAIKVAIISSPELFDLIQQAYEKMLYVDIQKLNQVIKLAVAGKIALIEKDPYEKNLKRSLNFGHLIGHAIEAALNYEAISHGQSVAIGMASATRIAMARDLCDWNNGKKIINLIEQLGLPIYANEKVDINMVLKNIDVIRYIRNGHHYEVLPTGIGSYEIIDTIYEQEFRESIVEHDS